MSWNEKEYTETNGEWVWLKGINTFEKTKKQKTQNKQKKKNERQKCIFLTWVTTGWNLCNLSHTWWRIKRAGGVEASKEKQADIDVTHHRNDRL